MTRSAASASGVIVCPRCGRTAPADAVVCGFCWQTLREASTADERRAARALAAEEESVRRGRRGRLVGAVRLVLLAVLVTFVTWRVKFGGASPIPLPQSTARTEQAAAGAPSEWPTTNGDVGSTRVTAAAAGLDRPLGWRADLGSPVTTQPVIGDQALYVGVQNAALVALALNDGHELWRVPVPGQLDAAPALAGDRLYLPLRDGEVMAVDAHDGHVIWTAGEGPSFVSSPLVADGIVYAESLGDVRAFDAESGQLLWRQLLTGDVPSPAGAALSANDVVVATFGSAAVFSRKTGTRTFFYNLKGPTHLVVQGGQVFVTGANTLVAFGFEQRRPWWDGVRTAWVEMWLFGMAPAPPAPPSHWVVSNDPDVLAPTVAQDILVVASTDGQTRGYDVGTGKERWTYSGSPPAAAPLTASDGVLLIESDALVLLDPATGVERARRVLNGEQLGALSVVSSGTYAVTHDSEILALR